jgi:LPXTG-motif cell wall-anchored protein
MSARVRRFTVLVSVIACVITSTAVMAFAQNYPPHRPTCSVSQGTVAPGESITVSGTNWRPNFTVTIALKGDGILGTATANAQGSFSTIVTIPSDAPTGSTQIMCRGQKRNGGALVLGTTITIVAAAGGGITAFTGAQIEIWMILAVALLVVGLGLILISRRRRTSLRH